MCADPTSAFLPRRLSSGAHSAGRRAALAVALAILAVRVICVMQIQLRVYMRMCGAAGSVVGPFE